MENNHTQDKDAAWVLYLIGGISAFLAVLLEWIKAAKMPGAQEVSTLYRFGDFLSENFDMIHIPTRQAAALVFIFCLGIFLSYVYQPARRREAFALGLSLTMILGISVPVANSPKAAQQASSTAARPASSTAAPPASSTAAPPASSTAAPPAKKSDANDHSKINLNQFLLQPTFPKTEINAFPAIIDFLIPSAFSQTKESEKSVKYTEYYFEFTDVNVGVSGGNLMTISIFSLDKGSLQLREKVDPMKIWKIKMPRGAYYLEADLFGYKTQKFTVYFEEEKEAFKMSMRKSSFTDSFASLFNVGERVSRDLDESEKEKLIHRYDKQEK